MDVSKYIAAFLIEKGTLNLPGFGYFTSDYRPAEADGKNSLIYPPGKTYTFTPGDRIDDEGLSLFLAGKENIPVSMAGKEIEEYVEGCHYVIGRGKKLEIPGIGLIWKDEQGVFRFEQERHLAEEGGWYGLPVLPLKPARAAGHYRTAKIIMAVFIVAGLVLGGFYAGMIADLLKEKFGKVAVPPAGPVGQHETPVAVAADSLVTFATDSLPEQEPVMVGGEDSVSQPAEQAPPDRNAHSPGEAGYYIVAGCFRHLTGAEKTVKELREKGFDAALFGQDRQGLHLVSYAYFPVKKDALSRLRDIRKTHPEAWLLKFP